MQKGYALPPKILIWGLAFGLSVLTLRSFQFQLYFEYWVSLLSLLLGVKLLETLKYRDLLISLLVCFTCLLGYIMFSSDSSAIAILIIDVGLISGLMYRLHIDEEQKSNFWSHFKPVAGNLAKSIPLVILLFFVFPRFTPRAFSLNSGREGQVGFSDNLNPGDVSKIVKSNRTAFRVDFFEGTKPEIERLYWRAGSLDTSYGLNWKNRKRRSKKPEVQRLKKRKGEPTEKISYDVILEPLFGRWLFPLSAGESLKIESLRSQLKIDWVLDQKFL